MVDPDRRRPTILPLVSRLYFTLRLQFVLFFTPGLQSVFYPWSAVCISPLVSRLYFSPGLQTVFQPSSTVCILPLVSRLFFTPGLQSVFYPWSTVCISPLICSLYFTPGLQIVFYPWSTRIHTNIKLTRKDQLVVYSVANEFLRWSLSCGYKLALAAC